MEINRNLRFSLLFEMYGQLLTSKQIAFLKDFLDNDLSLSEIAEKNVVSRQSVNDLVKRSLKILEDYEGKLHFLKKFEGIKSGVSTCKELLSQSSFDKRELERELSKILEVL